MEYTEAEYRRDVKEGVISVLEEFKKRPLEKYNSTVSRVSGMNDSATNDYYRSKSREIAELLAEFDKEIAKPFMRIPDRQSHLLEKTKNQITDIICPLGDRGRRGWDENMRKAAKIANTLEGFLKEAFSMGYNLNAKLTDAEKEEITDAWKDKVEHDIREHYWEGSRALIMLLEARLASDKIDNELKERGL